MKKKARKMTLTRKREALGDPSLLWPRVERRRCGPSRLLSGVGLPSDDRPVQFLQLLRSQDGRW